MSRRALLHVARLLPAAALGSVGFARLETRHSESIDQERSSMRRKSLSSWIGLSSDEPASLEDQPIIKAVDGVELDKAHVESGEWEDAKGNASDSSGKASTKEKIIGQYENRIRCGSTPEKIFNTFASQKDPETGTPLMSWDDFRRAILPYDFRPDAGRRRMIKPPAFLEFMDLDGDGMIDFAEFCFVTSVIGIPLEQIELALRMFDEDYSMEIDRVELEKALEMFRPSSISAYTFEKSVEESAVMLKLFENGSVPIEKLKTLINNLRRSVLRMEFDSYDSDGSGDLSPKDFAMTLISYAHHSTVSLYLPRVDTLDIEGKVTYSDFVYFNEAMHFIDTIITALRLYTNCDDHVNKDTLCRAIFAVTGWHAPPVILEVLMHMFDIDEDGSLDLDDLDHMVKARLALNTRQHRDAGVVRFGTCLKDCFLNTKSHAI